MPPVVSAIAYVSTEGPELRSRWKVVASPQVSRWYAGLDDRQALSVKRAVDELAARGSAIDRPRSAPIHGSRHHSMRELRSVGGNLRVLYAFHKNRAVLLAGGDKTGNWKGWYKRNVKRADRRLDDYKRTLGGDTRWRNLRIGRGSQRDGP
jgi:hypothetical protein